MRSIALLNILWRRKWIVVWAFVSTVVGAEWTVRETPRRYDAVARASIDPGLLDPVDDAPFLRSKEAAQVFQGNMIALSRSRRVALDVVRKLRISSDPAAAETYRNSPAAGAVDIDEWLAEGLSANVHATFVDSAGPSYILHIIFSSASPGQAAIMANAFLASFIDAAIEMKTGFALHGAEWFDPQIEKARASLRAAQAALDRAMEQSQTLPQGSRGGDEGDVERATVSTAATALSEAKAELTAMESQLAGSASARAFSNEAETVDTRTAGDLRDQLLRTDADIAKLTPLLGPQNPKLKELSRQRESLSAQIDDQIQGEQERLRERIAAQRDRVAKLKLELEAETRKLIGAQPPRDELARLSREAQLRQDQLASLQAAASGARLHGQMSFLNIAVLDKALPPTEPAFPNVKVALIASPALGLLLGLIMALLVEAFDRRIRLASDLDFAIGAPVLGAIPLTRQTSSPGRTTATPLGLLAALKSAWGRNPTISRAG